MYVTEKGGLCRVLWSRTILMLVFILKQYRIIQRVIYSTAGSSVSLFVRMHRVLVL